MQHVTPESWKGHVVTRASLPESYIAIVRIERQGQVLADWHLPRYSNRWVTEAEARREALGYAVKLIERGVLAGPEAAQALAA